MGVTSAQQTEQPSALVLRETLTSDRQTTPCPPRQIIPLAAMAQRFVLRTTTALVEHLVGELDHMERISDLRASGSIVS